MTLTPSWWSLTLQPSNSRPAHNSADLDPFKFRWLIPISALQVRLGNTAGKPFGECNETFSCLFHSCGMKKMKRQNWVFELGIPQVFLTIAFWQSCGLLFPFPFTQGLKIIPYGSWFIRSQKLKGGQKPSFSCVAGTSLDKWIGLNCVPFKVEFRGWRDGLAVMNTCHSHVG